MKKSKNQKIKIEQRIEELKDIIDVLKKALVNESAKANNENTILSLKKQINDTETELKKASISLRGDIEMSDHAFVRFISRILGINTDELAKKVVTPELKSKYAVAGDGTYAINHLGTPFSVVIKNGTIVTIIGV